jgi:L-iditol 2-dehydrogenase
MPGRGARGRGRAARGPGRLGPGRIESGALLVRTEAATVCATDVHVWKHALGTGGGVPDAYTVILGHEMTGRIVRFGEGPRTDSVGQALAEGDRIVRTLGYCGRCVNCVVEHMPSTCRNRRRYMSECCIDYPYLTGASPSTSTCSQRLGG